MRQWLALTSMALTSLMTSRRTAQSKSRPGHRCVLSLRHLTEPQHNAMSSGIDCVLAKGAACVQPLLTKPRLHAVDVELVSALEGHDLCDI